MDFNPHSHKGSDDSGKRTKGLLVNFNPHSHKGSDLQLLYTIKLSKISIHTPTRGVTLLNQYPGLYENDFNPHSHKGSDNGFRWSWRLLVISIHTPTRGVTDNGKQEGIYMQFQSTLPQGEWPKGMLLQIFWQYFNPHSHKGSDAVP